MWWGKQAAVLTGLALNLNPQRQASTAATTLLCFHSPVPFPLSRMVISCFLLALHLRVWPCFLFHWQNRSKWKEIAHTQQPSCQSVLRVCKYPAFLPLTVLIYLCFDPEPTQLFVDHLLLVFLPAKGLHPLFGIIFFLSPESLLLANRHVISSVFLTKSSLPCLPGSSPFPVSLLL